MEITHVWVVRNPELQDGTRKWLWEEYDDSDRQLAYWRPEGHTIVGFMNLYVGTYRLDPMLWEAENTKVYSDAESALADVRSRLERDTARVMVFSEGGCV